MKIQHPEEIRGRLATGSQAEKIFLLYRKADYGPRWKAAWEPNPVYWINGKKRKLFLFADGSALETWLPGKDARYFHHAVLDAEEARRLLVAADKDFNDVGDGVIDHKGLLTLIVRSGLLGYVVTGNAQPSDHVAADEAIRDAEELSNPSSKSETSG